MDAKLMDRLEKKAHRLVEVVEDLRGENLRLTRELEDAQDALAAEKRAAPAPEFGERMKVLEEERVAVRGRVEKLVAFLEDAT